jgi:hypothetical protein
MPNKNKLAGGIIMVACGLIMMITSALNYFFKWGELTVPYAAIGIMFTAIGAGFIKKSKSE